MESQISGMLIPHKAKRRAKPAKSAKAKSKASRKPTKARKSKTAPSRAGRAKSRSPRFSEARKNGFVLTAKNLPMRAYSAIHDAPHGVRQKMLHALLDAAASFIARAPGKHMEAIATGKIRIVGKSR